MSKQTRAGRLSVLLRLTPRILCAVLLVVALLSVFYTRAHVPTRVYAQSTSSTMNFQGRLLAANGNIVPDGYYNLQFKLYTTATDGTGTNLWTETYYDANGATAGQDNRVRVVNGYFSVNLGSQTAFSGINWDQELWLTMNVGDSTQTATPTWDGEMLNATQRTKLTAVPYAFTAGQLAQSSGGNRGTLGFTSVTNNPNIVLPNIAGTNNVLLQSGTTLFTQGSIPFTDANGRLTEDNANFYFDNTNDRLGLGTASPQATLHVNGTVRFEDFTSCTALETDASGNLVCGADDGSNGAFLQGGNSFTATAVLGTNDAFDLEVETSGVTRLVVQADGDVAIDSGDATFFVDATNNRIGIGDATPDAKLDVELSSTSTTADTRLGQTITVTDTGIVTTGTDTTYGQQISVTRSGATGGTINTYGLDIQATGDAGGTSQVVGLNVNVSGADTSYAALFNGGRVGVGTTTPNKLLHVASTGDARIQSSTSGTTSLSGLLLGNDTNANAAASLFLGGSAYASYGGANSLNLINSLNAPLTFGTNNVVTATILGNGNFGVGDTSPAYLFTVGNGDLSGFDSTGALGVKTGGAAATADLSFGVGNRTINVLTQTTADAAGGSLSITAGAANGSTVGNVGGALNLTGGAAAGTGNNAGGAVAIQGGAPTGTGSYGHVTIQGAGGYVGIGEAAPTATLHVDGTIRFEDFVSCTALETDASGNLVCGTAIGGNAFVQGGNSFTATAVLGTNDAFNLEVETAGVTRLVIESDGDVNIDSNTFFVGATDNRVGILDATPAYAFTVGSGDLSGIDSTGALGVKTAGETIGYDFALGQGGDRTIGVNTRTTNAAGRSLTVTAGDAGAGASAFSGGILYLQGGDAAGTGNANGGAITIIGGAGVGTGTQGLVNLSTTAFTSAAVQSFGSGVNGIAAGLVDLYSTIPVNATSTAAVVSVPDPAQNTVIGRILYITARNGSTDFTLRLNASGTPIDIAMKQNSTATLIWNGDDWTAAGASSSTDLQSAYNNTLTSAGGAEIILNGPGGNADGFTIRNNAANPIVGGLLEVQSSIGTNLFSVNNYGIELAANGGAENSSTFAASWPASGGSTITRTTTAGQFVTGLAGVQVATTAAANDGVKNDLTGNPAVSTTYQVSFTAKLSSGTFSTLQVAYSRDGGTDIETCTNYSTQTLSTSVWTKITCIITTDATAPSNPQLIIRQTDATARTFWIDNLSFQRNDATTNTTPSNVQIGGGINGGPVTLLTLDRSSSPPVPNGDSTYYGSMYYDTGTGRIQCYEADGWGACGSAPDNIISLTPEYSGAVLNGTGVGTMTADFCANQSSVLVVGSLCASGLSRQFYKWTSPQANTQTYSIYVSYKLPNTFKEFISNDTITLTGLADNVTNGQVTFQVFRSSGSAITACGTETDVVATTDTANTWYTRSINGNEMTGCSFAASDTVIFKINVKAKTNASVYVENLNFTYTNR